MAIPVANAVGNIFAVKTFCFMSNQLGLNITHWRVESLIGTGEISATNIAKYFDVNFCSLVKPCLTSKASYLGASAQKVFPTKENEGLWNITSGPGGAGATPLPTQTSGLVSLRSEYTGRGKRGRMYVPFPSTDAIDAGSANDYPNVAYQALLEAYSAPTLAPQNVTSGGNGVELVCVIMNRTLPGDSAPVISRRAAGRWATQKRRGDFGPANFPPFI